MAGAFSGEAAKNIPIDFSSVESLPESRTSSNNFSDVVDDMSMSIPVVDLQDPNAKESISRACGEWGAFQLKNHGIPLSLLKEVDDEIKRFFSLPTEQKEKGARAPGSISGYGSPKLKPFFSNAQWHEGFVIMSSRYDDVKKVFPEDDCARFCETMEEIQKKLKLLVEKVTNIILELLGARGEEEKWAKTDNYALKMYKYPTCPATDRILGLDPHRDTSIVTFLHQTQVEAKTGNEIRAEDQTRGFQVFKEGIGWVPVQMDSNMFVVIVGDVLEILSNGRFKSNLHRVTVSETAYRYSYAYFQRLSREDLLCPIGSPPRFRAITLGEYDVVKFKDPHKALSSISI
ncbi:hypothetical protein QN277_019124 [Acacia crassicarpa]|uniref:Fe2OG dioxygenase domain-containing protein n=1 Tax=Acacia crassicarpa TaxID=499986 RepID=A0AAE1JXB7_9FABA|nr:hypothetical protein QN277_019124 [Acacia crassicarpa]